MNKTIDKLIGISGEPFASRASPKDLEYLSMAGKVGEDLLRLLELKNGFYAFESCLSVFPLKTEFTSYSLQRWNSIQGWRSAYNGLIPPDTIFFAQDTFGNQFYLDTNGVGVFNGESAEFRKIGASIADWADMVLNNWRTLFEFDLAHEWQLTNGALTDQRRLIPKIPFVIGGKREISNLYAGEIDAAMRFRASLAHQITNLRDGTPVTIKIA